MLGRHRNLASYRQLLALKKFYLVAAGVILMALAYWSRDHAWLYPALALGALAVLGGPIVLEALKGLRRREVNVDELVSLAIIASILVGEYFSGAVVALIMVVGSLLEEFYSQKARSSIEALAQLAPEHVAVLRDGEEMTLPVADIQPGDRVLVRTGERIPVDGEVRRGDAAINEASLTGEALPVNKSGGSPVFAGTLVYTGMLELEATRVGEDTTLEKLIRLVEEAEQQKAPILRNADAFARYFTPVILTLALLVYLVTGDVYRAITILIVGCPCALVLSTPSAVISALGNASKNGVLIKGGSILEELSRINALIFDKTGTLTTGEPLVQEVVPSDGVPVGRILQLAAAAEKHSRHPLARAIQNAVRREGLPVPEPENYRNVPGQGVEAWVEGRRIEVLALAPDNPGETGSAAGTAPGAGPGTDAEAAPASAGDANGKSLAVREDGILLGQIVIAEEMRPQVPAVIRALSQQGVEKVMLLTGDNRAAALRLAGASGIADYQAHLTPRDKLRIIKDLQQQRYSVAMVGDGVNDAPSLAAANVGVAMEAMGTDAALEAADVALLKDDLGRLPYLLRLGQATVRTIHLNIAFALVFNVLALAASGAGLLTPITGALAHNAGSVLVVLNSYRLVNYRCLAPGNLCQPKNGSTARFGNYPQVPGTIKSGGDGK